MAIANAERVDLFCVLVYTINTTLTLEDTDIFTINTTTKKIAYTAVFAALTFVMNYTYIPFGGLFGVSFVIFSCCLAGVFLGPWLGFVACGLADFLGCVAHGYAPNIYILLGTACWGLFFGLSYSKMKSKSIWKIIVGGCVAFVICSMLLNSYGMYLMVSKGDTFLPFLIARLPIQFTNFACNLIFSVLFVDILERRGII